MSWRTPACALVLSVTLGVLGVPVAGAAAPAPEPPPTTAAPSPPQDARDLTDDYVVPGDRERTLQRVRRWPGTRIRYYESIPRKWHWGLSRAIDHWNTSGGRIRFVKVRSKRKAQLVIRYGDTGGADGVATLGPTPNAFVHLSPAYKQADPDDPTTRVWVGRLFAHELGHVLGYGHSRGSCSLMVPVFFIGPCPLLSDTRPGYYLRRWIDRKLLGRHVDTYGGSARRPPKLGLIAPLPPQLEGLGFDGGQAEDRAVTVSWRPPDRVAEGTRVRIQVWQGDACAAGPPEDSFVEQYERKPGAGSWTDPGLGGGTWCYSVQVENRYGAARPPSRRAMARWTPTPDAPVVTLAWDEQEALHRLAWSGPDGVQLAVRRDWEDPENCLTTFDEGAVDVLFAEQDGGYALSPVAPRECLVFFAVADWGTVSPATALVVEVPAFPLTPVVGDVSPDPEDPWLAVLTATLPEDPVDRHGVGIEVLPGACPPSPPADAGWWDGSETAPGRWSIWPEAEGLNCVLVTAVDRWFWSFVRHGAVVQRQFTWSSPS